MAVAPEEQELPADAVHRQGHVLVGEVLRVQVYFGVKEALKRLVAGLGEVTAEDWSCRDGTHDTPLVRLVGRGAPSVVERALRSMDDAERRAAGLNEALHVALIREHPDRPWLKMVRVLLEAGADPNAWYEGQTPLTLLLGHLFLREAPQREALDLLLARGADLHAVGTGHDWPTPMLEAVRTNVSWAVLERLMAAGASLGPQGPHGLSPVDEARRLRPDATTTADLEHLVLQASEDRVAPNLRARSRAPGRL